ncbi:MAG: hypothetical protein ABIG61_07730 [Planctomycetota bacterium]
MDKNKISLTFHIPEIPDPNFSQFQAVAGGDVRKAAWQACEHILRTLSNMPSSSISAEILFIHDPAAGSDDRQSRLKLYLRLEATEPSNLKSIGHLVKGSMLSRFYKLETLEQPFLEPEGLKWNCSVIRREDFVRPLHDNLFNAKVPEYYYTVIPFDANEKNDVMMLDSVLDKVDKPVIISIKLKPVDISAQLHSHTAYLARLSSINRSWEDEYELKNNFDNFSFSENDLSNLARSSQELKPLTCRDPLADDIFRQQKKFHESLRTPHLQFGIQIMAENESTARLVGSIIAESSFQQGSYRLLTSNTDCDHQVVPDSICDEAKEYIDIALYNELRPLTQLATADELLGLFRLPVASFSSPFCIRKNTDPKFVDPKDLIVLGYDQHSLYPGGKPIPRGIHINVLKKGGVVLGLPGMGKNTNNINIQIQLSDKDTPYMMIESAKTEYRALKKFTNHENPSIRKLARNLKVFTAGSETSPLTINPLRIPKGVYVNEHIENLLACFKAVLPVASGSLPALLGEALEIVYERFPEANKPPVMSDLVDSIQQVLDSKGYSPNTRSDMQTVTEVRIGVLAQRLIGRVFGCRGGISIEELMEGPSIIETDKLCGEQKCLLILFIFMLIREILKTSPLYKGPLRFAILIEEAHNIFGSSNITASEEIADPKSQLTEFLSQMMVELRALGVAIILSSQHPLSLAPGAVKTPASKVVFLQVANREREEIGGSMLLDGSQMQDIARFGPGEAFLFTEGYHYPRRIKTINLHEQFDLSTIHDDELHQMLSTEDWFIQARIQRVKDELFQFNDCINRFEEKRKKINLEVQHLVQLREKVIKLKNSKTRKDSLSAIIKSLRTNKEALFSEYRKMTRNIEKRFGHLRNHNEIQNEYLEKLSESKFRLFDNSIKSHVNGLMSAIDIAIKKCQQLKFKE